MRRSYHLQTKPRGPHPSHWMVINSYDTRETAVATGNEFARRSDDDFRVMHMGHIIWESL